MSWGEKPEIWARWWVLMWLVMALVLIVMAFLQTPMEWSITAALLFGVPEAVALLRHDDRYPPLTYVTAYYLPRWLTMTLIGFLTGSIGATWLGFHRPFSLGALLGLLTWALSHFATTYEGRR